MKLCYFLCLVFLLWGSLAFSQKIPLSKILKTTTKLIKKGHKITRFIECLKSKCGEIGELKATRGKVHTHLGMKVDCSHRRKVKIHMIDHLQDVINTCPDIKPDDEASSPANSDSFKVDNGPKLNQQGKELFHTLVAKCLFICKQARPDI